MTAFDAVVIGQGLAGTALAWALRWRGLRVLVVDREAGPSASRVAAGLVTPVTGLRLVKTWQWDEFFPAAVAFYRRVEVETSTRLFTVRPSVRLFSDAAERARFEQRNDPAVRGMTRSPDPPMNGGWFAAPQGGFEMTTAARLDVGRYLDASREAFARDGCYRAADLHPGRDIQLVPAGFALPLLDAWAGSVVFCQGLGAWGNPWFPDVRFTPAKGEVLTLRIPGLAEERVVHRGVWLAPEGGEVFRAGATYDRDDLTPVPTIRGRDEICDRLRAFLRLPFEVVGHQAAVRPVVDGGKPVTGLHPTFPQLGYFNGLGSKGVLLSPSFATRLADRIAGNGVHFGPGSC